LSDENKAIVERFYHEIVNQGNLDLVDELMSSYYIEHGNPAGSGIDGFKKFVSGLSTAFPDLQITVEDMLSEEDKVAARVTVRATHKGTFMGGILPTGKQVNYTGIDIFQIANGKIAGRWNQRDLLGLMQQLGVVSLPG
jgi:steroid delta-isomerase-like uncharacterized protein